MNKKLLFVLNVFVILSSLITAFAPPTHAQNTEQSENITTGISITPVSNFFSLAPSKTYDSSFKITNQGSTEMQFEAYAAPYSYTYSERDDEYKLGFSRETNYTQITRWITFRDTNNQYVKKATFSVNAGDTVEVFYRITTPASIPAGGQYTVLFAHTINNTVSQSGIKTEASPGLIIFGRAIGETIKTNEISNLSIDQKLVSKIPGPQASKIINHINATGKVKNTGNVDFTARGVLTVKGILGHTYYQTPDSKPRVMVIPEAELTVTDEWAETPLFGLFKVSWSVSVDEKVETISRTVLILPLSIILIAIMLLTIIIIWVIFFIRKRKYRRSKLLV